MIEQRVDPPVAEPVPAVVPRRRRRIRAWHVSLLQGVFWLITGLWPLLHMPSFLAVSGPKHDLWLVRAMGLLISVVGATLVVAGGRRRVTLEIVLLGVGGALALAAIDVYYSLAGVIWKTYLLDAAAELVLVALWAWALATSWRRDDG